MSDELKPVAVKKPLSAFSTFCIAWMIAWVEMLVCFGVTAFGLIMLKPVTDGELPYASTLSGVLGLGGTVFCLSLFVSFVAAFAVLPLKGLSFKSLLWPLTVMVLSFCGSYIVVDLLLGSPQQALLDAIQASIYSDGFAISKRLSKQLGWLSFILFPLFLLTGLLDLLLLPFVPFFNRAVQVQALLMAGYGVLMLIVSAIPASITGWWVAKHQPPALDDAQALEVFD